ncbi:sodium:alanine symporter family protein [candidate division KSB1 bacterium]|nr:sodium:alanine symporter family protein [candidate division KSB1 bacterium]
MIETILKILTDFDKVLWGPWTMIFIAAVAIYLTMKSRFFQFFKFSYIIRNTFGIMFKKPEDEAQQKMTPFQATATSLAGTVVVGMGNMAGVATALSVGGPGAIFWMWALAFFGMMTKTVEITLAVHYRELNKDGRPYGGPTHYINKGLGWKFLAYTFSAGMLINAVFSSSLLQAHTVGRAFLSSYQFNPYIVTALMAITTAYVVIGGIKRIGQFSERMVPFMSVIYILAGLTIFVVNYTEIPSVFSMIFKYAFAPAPAIGGASGIAVAAAIKQGMARGMLSNEAGLGTAPMVHATADTSHPFQQGIWGAFEVFVDTIIICTITSFAILSTGALAGGETGIDLVLTAFASVFPDSLASLIVSIVILTFCLSTQIGFFIYYETSINNLFGKNAIKYLKWLYFIPGVLFAGVANVDQLWVLANISVGVIAIPNLVAILVLSGVFFKLMKDYLSGKNEYATAIVDKSKNYIKMPK